MIEIRSVVARREKQRLQRGEKALSGGMELFPHLQPSMSSQLLLKTQTSSPRRPQHWMNEPDPRGLAYQTTPHYYKLVTPAFWAFIRNFKFSFKKLNTR